MLWKQLDIEQPERCFQSVSLLRDELIAARAAIPEKNSGVAEISQMGRAAEIFLNRYEKLTGQRAERFWSRNKQLSNAELLELIAELRSEFLPALERLRDEYDISPGRPPGPEGLHHHDSHPTA